MSTFTRCASCGCSFIKPPQQGMSVPERECQCCKRNDALKVATAVYDALGVTKPDVPLSLLSADVADAVLQQKRQLEAALKGPKVLTIRNGFKDQSINLRLEPFGDTRRIWRSGWMVIDYEGYIEEIEHGDDVVIVTFGPGSTIKDISE